ncbi:MAG: tRNA1(Val) (adenine(37)-N6)-methyltransferase [Candidatus Izemoplasmataceae bacterium]
MKHTLNKEEVLNDLLGYDGLKIIQRPDMFSFSLDSTLLADFVTINQKVQNLLDFGTGFAPIPLFLSLKTSAPITAIEIQEEVADIARRNVLINNLSNQIKVYKMDIKDTPKHFKPTSFDVITCNPPFFKYKDTSNVNESMYKTIARHEVLIDLETIIKTAKILLNNKGHLYMVHRSERLSEIITLLEKHKFALKRLRFVYPKANQEAFMVLIDATNNGQSGVKIEPPLIVHSIEGYTDEIKKIFNYGKE